MIRERTSAGLTAARAEGRIGGRRKKLDPAKRREIAESVISGRKTGAEMARLYNVSAPTVSRIVAAHRPGLAAGERQWPSTPTKSMRQCWLCFTWDCTVERVPGRATTGRR
jgi:hypothetical protein